MFDPSFFELIIICVVALLVLGPDKLPGAIKTLGLWIGRMRRSFNNIKREIEQEVGADEIRRQLRNEAIMEKFNNTKSQITQSIDSVKNEAESVKKDLNLGKEFSDMLGDSRKDDDSAKSDDIDPIEKLATSDPSARTVSQETAPEAQPASEPAPDIASEKPDDSGNADELVKKEKPEEQ